MAAQRAVFAYHERALRIDPRPDVSGEIPLAPATLRRWIGGVGLGARLLADTSIPRCDPLGSEAVLVFALSPLVGSPLTTSAKFAVVGISPLTGRVCDALSSSHFALAAKRAGLDALVISGAWLGPVVLLVDGLGISPPRVDTLPADHLWGMSAAQTESRLRASLGTDWQVASIGPAGEACIPYATISHDGRHAGRGGLGAVLGSKRVKAIAVRGDQRAPVADPSRTVAIARDLSQRSYGPATEKYRELGTIANLLVFNRLDALPARNFSTGHFEGAERLAEVDLGPTRRLARKSCAACTIGCEHIYESDGDRAHGTSGGVRMEYESLFALGPMCGVADAQAVLKAAQLCDEQGLDTISTGGTVAFAMEAAARGWLDARLPSGRMLKFGESESLLEAIGLVPRREGLGALLALGSRRLAERLGGDAPAYAMHVKGLEMPGYDPRALHAMALGLAVSTRGADHNRSGAYEADFSGRANRLRGDARSAELAVETEDRAALLDSLILCKFLRGTFDDLYEESAEMLRAVTGWDVDADELRGVARGIVDLRKALNQREGWIPAEDTLPASLLSEADDETEGVARLSTGRLAAMIHAYYQARGWQPGGWIPATRLLELGVDPGPSTHAVP